MVSINEGAHIVPPLLPPQYIVSKKEAPYKKEPLLNFWRFTD
jgi:hypothetical protein